MCLCYCLNTLCEHRFDVFWGSPLLYCIVSIHLYSASYNAHQSEALLVQEIQSQLGRGVLDVGGPEEEGQMWISASEMGMKYNVRLSQCQRCSSSLNKRCILHISPYSAKFIHFLYFCKICFFLLNLSFLASPLF